MKNTDVEYFYPFHFTPKLLEDIFHFSPTKQREFIRKLSARNKDWAEKFGAAFYPSLWQFLGDPSNWHSYEQIVKKIQNKKTPLTINEAVSQYHFKVHRERSIAEGEEDLTPLYEIMASCNSNQDFVDKFAELERLDNAAEVIWCSTGMSFADSEDLDQLCQEVLELAGEETGLTSLVDPMVAYLRLKEKIRGKSLDIPLEEQWISISNDLRALVEDLEDKKQHLEVAKAIRRCSKKLYKVAKKLSSAPPIDLSTIEDELEQLVDLINGDWNLSSAKILIERLSLRQPTVDGEQLDLLARAVNTSLVSLQQLLQEIRQLQTELQSSSRPDRKVARDLADKSEQIWQESESIQATISDLYESIGLDPMKEPPIEPPADASTSEVKQKESADAGPSPADDESEMLSGAEIASKVDEKQTKKRELDDTPTVSPHESSQETRIDEKALAEEAKPTLTEAAISDSDLELTGNEDEAETNRRLSLTRLIKEGNFRLAYWLCKAKGLAGHETPIDASFLGAPATALAEAQEGEIGSKIREFLTAISKVDHFGSNEQVLTATTLVTAAGLAGSAAQTDNNIQALANRRDLKSNIEALNELLQFVIDAIIRRGWSPERLNVKGLGARVSIDQRLSELNQEAKLFLSNLKQVRFSYQPAHSAFIEIFSPGSDFHMLLSTVAEGKASDRKRKRMDALIQELDPTYIVNNLRDFTSFSGHLQGPARSQFSSKLSRALDISSRWLGLMRERGRDAGSHDAGEFEEKFGTLLRKAVAALGNSEDKNPFSAAVAVGASTCLEKVAGILAGEFSHKEPPLNHALLEYSDIELDHDLYPLESDLPKLLEHLPTETYLIDEIVQKCIDRHEFDRAQILARRLEQPEKWIKSIDQKKFSLIGQLRSQCDQTEEDVEEINLLGMLSEGFRNQSSEKGDDATTGQTAPLEEPPTQISTIREILLSRLKDARDIIESAEQDGDTDVRSAIEILSQVTDYVGTRKQQRQNQLEARIKTYVSELRKAGHDESDAQYISDELDNLLSSGDNVALAELLDRTESAVREGTPVERISTESEPLADRFLKEYERLDELKKGRSLLSAIRSGQNIGPLQFANRDKAHRERAIVALGAWERLKGKASKGNLKRNDKDVESACREILSLVGTSDIRRFNHTNPPGPNILQIDAELDASLPCPIPAFGSELGDSLSIVLFGTKQQPRKIIQAVKKVKGSQAGLMAIHLDSLSARQRLDIRDLCSREKISCIVLDFPLLAFLCGARDPLLTLFDVALPLTWSQPYQMKGVKVPKEMFVGRDDHVNDLKDPGGASIVFGGRQLGKSALLRHLAEEHHAPEDGFFIGYKDIDDLGNPPQSHVEMEEDLWFRISQEISHIGFLPEQDQRSMSSGKITKKNARTKIPQLIRAKLEEHESYRLILLLDEVDDMLDMDSTADFRVVKSFRALMTETGQRFKTVFTGLKSVQRFNSYENQPFAQLGNALVVRPLPARDAEKLVRRPLRALGYTFETPSLLLRILSQSNYHPGLIQIFCYRLIKNLNDQRVRGGANRVITRHDVNLVERNPDFMEDIRNRFDWTLDLDERYKVLTYALVMSESASLQMTVSQFKAIGKSWWPQVFEHMEFQTMKGLLDEMEGLGVLLKIQENNQLFYRLRSPNLLRLLGSKNEIESEMERIIERPSPTKRNPRNFHKPLVAERAVFGPLTMEQESQIVDASAIFRVALVYGSKALGIGSAEEHIRHLMKSLGDHYGHPWKEIILPFDAIAAGERKLAGYLRDKFKPNKRHHLFVFCNLSELPSDVNPIDFVQALSEGPGRVCRNLSQGRIFLLADEEASWKLIRNRTFQKFVEKESPVVEIFLRRWSDGSISKALDDLGLKTRSRENGELIFSKSQGLHTIVQAALNTLNASSKSINQKTVTEAVKSAIHRATDPESGLGVEIDSDELRDLLLEVLDIGAGETADRLEWDETVDLLEGSYPELLEDSGRPFRRWIQAIGIGGPAFKDGQISLVTYSKKLIH